MISNVMILYPLVASNEKKKRKGENIKTVKKSKDAICINWTTFPLLLAKTVCYTLLSGLQFLATL